MSWRVINADVIDGLRQLPDESVHCVICSPPYLWQRDYNCDGQIGLEPTIQEYLARLIEVFDEVRRVLRKDGTLWVNIADGYVNDAKCGGASGHKNDDSAAGGYQRTKRSQKTGLPTKTLMAIPARFQIAMIDAGWRCRQEIIWHKPTARPESVQDRCSRDHEMLYLFSKANRYYFDQEAVKQPASPKTLTVKTCPRKGDGTQSAGERWSLYQDTHGQYQVEERNLRTVWSISAEPSNEQHYAAFPTALPTVCIQASTSEKGCCSACSAPWVRLVQKEKGTPKSFNGSSFLGGKTARAVDSFDAANGRQHSVGQGPRTMSTQTIGWKSSCECDAGLSDCLVLDPFAGTSTTGIAALRLGRRFIGIELNPEYAAISERRLREAERNSIGDLFMPAAAHVQQGLFAMNGGVDGHNGHAQAEPVRR